MRRFVLAALSLTLLVAVAAPTAAIQLPEGVEEQLSIDVTPTNPGPNQDVSITVKSFSTELGGAAISWFVDGVLRVSERGATKFTFKTGDVGSQTEVLVRITKAEGGELARVLTFAPADLELVFEPQTFTPPFYKGRSVYSHQAPYKAVAVPRFIGPNGARYSERDLVYTWRVNGRYVEGAGGLGGNVLEAKGALVSRPFDISVEAQTPDGSVSAKETIYIAPETPELVLYENDPLHGVLYNKAFDSLVDLGTKEKEITISAIPYYFGVRRPDSFDVEYQWSLAGKDVIMDRNENEMTVRVPEGEGLAGTNPVYVEARGITDVLQAAYTETVVRFGPQN